MHRRTFLALTALPALAMLLQACGGDDSSPTTTSPGGDGDGTDPARSDIARVKADPASAAVATAAINAFGADLHRQLATASPDENLVFSPASILLALAMTRAGAAGPTATEMDDVLHLDDADAFYRAANALSASLDRITDSVDIGADEPVDVVLQVANSLWGQRGFHFEQAFLDLLAGEFGAGLETIDYEADPEAARRAINAWVADATNDRIPELIAEGIITTDARLTLVNAIYMKAPWAMPFAKSSTSTAPFTLPDGSTAQVPMMHATRSIRHGIGAGWQAVELDYAGDSLAMLLVLPDADLATTEADLAGAWPSSADLDYGQVRLSVPRWDIETSTSLADTLAALGMPTAFTDDADFTGMTSEEPLLISAVIHQANITVDEEGTEAAAATAVMMAAGSAAPPDEPLVLTFDRPFLFAVRETQTGAVLFQGRITDPSATR